MKFAEYVELATRTNRLDFDEDRFQESVFLGPYLTFLTLTLSRISELSIETNTE